jgi:hypothetical protein
MSWLRTNPLFAALAAAAVVLAVVIGFESRFGASVGSIARPGAAARAVASEAKLLPPLASTAPEVAYPETTARPLFIPTRRPAPEAVAAPQATFQKGQFVLQGVIAVGDNRIAMLREKSSGRIFRVERGREVNGIKVVDIQPEAVTLAMGGEEEKLSLNVQKAAGVTPPAVSTGPFGAPAPAAPQQATPAVQPPPQPAPTFPLGPPGLAPGATQPPGVPPGGSPNANPAARPASDTASAPITPEELLARRRARRAQQTQ